MSSDPMKFLLELATDPRVMGDYMLDPGGVMEKEGLPKETRDAMLSGDALRIHETLNLGGLIAGEDAPTHPDERSRSVVEEAPADGHAASAGQAWSEEQLYQGYLWWLSANGIPVPENAAAALAGTASSGGARGATGTGRRGSRGKSSTKKAGGRKTSSGKKASGKKASGKRASSGKASGKKASGKRASAKKTSETKSGGDAGS